MKSRLVGDILEINLIGTMSKEKAKIEEPKESRAVAIFRAKCESAMAKINNYKKFEEEEEMVRIVMDAGRTLFDKPLDKMTPDTLLRLGGRLIGSFGYLGQRSAYARAERDVYEAKLSETEKELVLKYLENTDYKVTEAKAKVAGDVEELREFVIQKETAKNQWEAITEACQVMAMFCQSALKVKEGERYASSRMQNNG